MMEFKMILALLMDLLPNQQNFDLDKSFFTKRYQFPVRNTKWLKNGKLRKAILSAFYTTFRNETLEYY